MSFVSVDLCGGLGNMMFQIAAGVAYAKKYNKKFRVTTYNRSHHENENVDLFKYATENLVHTTGGIDWHTVYAEPSFSFTEIPRFEGNVFLKGYFQSSKYFESLGKTYLRKLFSCPEAEDRYGFIHIRRGDYLSKQSYHSVLTIGYYEDAIKQLPHVDKFYVLSDDTRWARENFSLPRFVHFQGTAVECMKLMTTCQYGILANSSFSWWGAYLSAWPKKFIAPKNWFGPDGPKEHDLYENDWIITA